MNRTYLKLNQDPRGCQPNETDEWMATIGKKKKKKEEEEEKNEMTDPLRRARARSRSRSLPPDHQFIEALINRP